MENTIITLTAEELVQQKNTRNIISALKKQLVNHMIVKKAENNDNISSEEMTKLRGKYPFRFEGDYITLIHIIHNRLRRGNKRPHLGTVERDNEFISNNKYELNKILEFLEGYCFDLKEVKELINI